MGEWLESLVPWGTEVIVWAQSYSTGWLEAVFLFFTRLGYEEFYLLLLPFVYWCINRRIGIGLGCVSLLSVWVNSLVKYIFAIPRPADARIRVPLPDPRPSFPSGHAQNAVVNWGYLAYRFRNRVLSVVAIIAILGISLSRVVLGVHFPQDVIAGWIIGLLLLVGYIWAEPRVERWAVGQPVPVQLALVIVVPVLLIFVYPADSEGRYPVDDAITSMSALIGLGIGLIMERSRVRFEVEGVWWQRGIRFLVGLVVVVVVYVIPKLIVPEGLAYGLESVIRFVRYALLGWIVAFLCPWLFVRLRLAGQQDALPGKPSGRIWQHGGRF